MNPFPMLLAEIRALGWNAAAIVLLVALAVGVGIAINAQERTLRRSSAAAADDFDLLVGAPGSQTQLVLTTIFLQPEALPLLSGDVLPRLLADKRVQDAAPIAFGDIALGYPVVGTTRALATRWGRLTPREGRIFAAPGEAVAGADVAFAIGATFAPAHATAGIDRQPGREGDDEAEHRHHEITYTIVGRLPRLGSPWDRAILVPIESVWAVHGLLPAQPALPAAKPPDQTAPGAPIEAFAALTGGAPLPGVPAIVVKPRSVADAYALRGAFRQGGTMAFFPAEVLVSLYGALGNVRDILVAASVLNTILMFAAVVLLLFAIAGLRARRYAILRALGAPRRYILLLVWLNAMTLLSAGCILGLAAGWALDAAAAAFLFASTGLRLAFVFDPSDLVLVGGLILAASLFALVPAQMSYRRPIIDGLRG